MSRFLSNLSALLCTADTRALELVVGLIALVFSGQLAATLLDFLPHSALVRDVSYPVAWLLVLLFLMGGMTKAVGSIYNRVNVRMVAAMSLSGVWAYLAYISLQIGAVFSLLLFTVFALQSAWVYIRLSIGRKQANAS